jgi:tetratricopeptide (TPR) repeat protein
MATMRSDFFHRCADVPGLVELKKGDGQYHLPAPSFSEVGQMIRYPAEAAGVRFEENPETKEKLDEVIHGAAAQNLEVLPLLEFTLDELFKMRTETGMLTFKAYRELGGLEGALARRAEDVLAGLEERVRSVFPQLFRRLVAIEHGNEDIVVRRWALYAGAVDTPDKERLVEEMVKARLLVTDRNDAGEAVVGVAHEALLEHWPRLRRCIAEDREFLHARDRIADMAARWLSEGRRKDYLLQEGKPLSEAGDLLKNRGMDLEGGTVEYIRASIKQSMRTRKIKRFTIAGVAAAFFISVLVFALFSYMQWQQVTKQQELAMEAIDKLTYDIPGELYEVPGTIPVLRNIYEGNVELLDEIMALGNSDTDMKNKKAVNYKNIAGRWQVLGDLKSALQSYEKSAETFKEVLKEKDDPNIKWELYTVHIRIGDVSMALGNRQKAGEMYDAALALLLELDKLNSDIDTRFDKAYVYGSIARLKEISGNREKAIELYYKAIGIYSEMVGDQIDYSVYQNIAVNYSCIGNLQILLKDKEGGVRSYNAALDYLERQREDIHNNMNNVNEWSSKMNTYLYDTLCKSYTITGSINLSMNNLDAALHSYKKALEIALELSRDSENTDFKESVAAGYMSVGSIYHLLNDFTKSREMLEKGLQYYEELARNKYNLSRQFNLADSYKRMAEIYLAYGDNKTSIEFANKSLSMAIELAKDKENTVAQEFLASAYGGLAYVQLFSRNPKEAIEASKKALEHDKDELWMWMDLVYGYLFDGQYEKAVEICLKYKDERILTPILLGSREIKTFFDVDFSEALLEGLNLFRKEGIVHTDMDKLEKLLKGTN